MAKTTHHQYLCVSASALEYASTIVVFSVIDSVGLRLFWQLKICWNNLGFHHNQWLYLEAGVNFISYPCLFIRQIFFGPMDILLSCRCSNHSFESVCPTKLPSWIRRLKLFELKEIQVSKLLLLKCAIIYKMEANSFDQRRQIRRFLTLCLPIAFTLKRCSSTFLTVNVRLTKLLGFCRRMQLRE